MSVCPSVHPSVRPSVRPSIRPSGHPHGILSTHWTSLHESWYLSIFQNCWENYIFTKIWGVEQVLHLKTSVHLWSYLAHFFLAWEMFQTSIVEKVKTHILCSIMFVQKSCHLWDKMLKKKTELDRPLMIWRMCVWDSRL